MKLVFLCLLTFASPCALAGGGSQPEGGATKTGLRTVFNGLLTRCVEKKAIRICPAILPDGEGRYAEVTVLLPSGRAQVKAFDEYASWTGTQRLMLKFDEARSLYEVAIGIPDLSGQPFRHLMSTTIKVDGQRAKIMKFEDYSNFDCTGSPDVDMHRLADFAHKRVTYTFLTGAPNAIEQRSISGPSSVPVAWDSIRIGTIFDGYKPQTARAHCED